MVNFHTWNEQEIDGIPGDHGLNELWNFDVTDGALHERIATSFTEANGSTDCRDGDLRHTEDILRRIPDVTGYRVRPEERQAVERQLLAQEGLQIVLLRTDVRCKAFMDITYGVIAWLGGAYGVLVAMQNCPQMQQWQSLILSTMGSITYALSSWHHRARSRSEQEEIAQRTQRMQGYWTSHPTWDTTEMLKGFGVKPEVVSMNGEVPKKPTVLSRSIPVIIEIVQTSISLLTGLRIV